MVWIGGTRGAGKSTLAQHLALAHDLPVHHIDAYTFDHAARVPPRRTLDADLALGPVVASNSWDEWSRARISLVLQDLRGPRSGRRPGRGRGASG